MKRFIRIALGAVVALIGCGVFFWVVLPQRTAAVLIQLNNMSAGLVDKTLATEIGDIHYLEGGQGQTIVLVHGIYARKEHWVDLARHLVDDYHVIALDLPGFGDNAALADGEYLLDRQRDNLSLFFDGLGLVNAHVAANSMGAYVSVLLAQTRPDIFSSLAFIGSPLGVPTPRPSDMDKALAQGEIPLLVQSEDDFHQRNAWLSPKMPYLPGPILNSWMQSEVARGDQNARVWDIVHTQSDVPTVLDIAPDLAMDALVIWCNPDRIFHISGAQVLDAALQASTLVTLEGCGHLPMLDQTDKVAAAYLDFLQTVTPQGLSK
ncbi:alpha/beta hydrolase [Ascidiaceihabitans sp.]|uniref:alpha/beta fold hydrolase n=1 Tax=Ascidiaceihabitans sp. TaxID=1872644 RepID=UPI00329A052D